MTMLSIVCTKLLCTNAHLGRRVADHHFKVYIRGSRNGIAILDSDKTLICLRNALHFIGSPSRQKGRSFFLKTNHLIIYEITEEMASYLRSYLRNVNSHCFDDSQWKIGAFLTNSFANKKKFRSRKKKINFGLNQQPDCVVILNADRKSSVILEADRSQIPIPSLVDSTIPWESYKRITYPIPANDPIQFVYLFRHSIMKTVILEQNAISREAQSLRVTLSTGKSAGGMRSACYSTSSSSPIDEEENRAKALLEMRKKYPSGDGADADANARKAVLQAISQNSFFFVELITRFGPIDSESDRGVAGSHLAFAHRIEEILEFHGKSSGSLKDLIDLKLDLEDASKREEILLPYFSSKKEAKS